MTGKTTRNRATSRLKSTARPGAALSRTFAKMRTRRASMRAEFHPFFVRDTYTLRGLRRPASRNSANTTRLAGSRST
eukprot:9042252-Lingulodinium_polyedra.AAC.1